MSAQLEVWSTAGAQLVPLAGERLTLGKGKAADIQIPGDEAVSRVHAVLERYGDAWAIKDMSSRNGTHVNGERVIGERPLHDGDEILTGSTRLMFRQRGLDGQSTPTTTVEAPPDLTAREREVLVELCRPLLSGDPFTGPSSVKELAERLYISEAGVRQHLARLSQKFTVDTTREQRRVALANEALRRGAVSVGDLKKA